MHLNRIIGEMLGGGVRRRSRRGSRSRRSSESKDNSITYNSVRLRSNQDDDSPLSEDDTETSASSLASPVTCRSTLNSDISDSEEIQQNSTLESHKRPEEYQSKLHDIGTLKAFQNQYGESSSKNQTQGSVPFVGDLITASYRKRSRKHIGAKEKLKSCHCIACCSCSPPNRLNGSCPVWRRACAFSTSSLDRAVKDLRIACQAASDTAATRGTQSATLPKVTQKHQAHEQAVLASLDRASCQTCRQKSGDIVRAKSNVNTREYHCDSSTENTTKKYFDRATTCDIESESKRAQPPARKLTPTSYKTKSDELESLFCSFDDEQKNLMLVKLLRHCGIPQTHLLLERLGAGPHPGCPRNCLDRVQWLPPQLVLHIFSFLDPVSLCRASLVCQVWYDLATEPCLWRHLCSLPKWTPGTTGEDERVRKRSNSSRDPNHRNYWKVVFSERFRLHSNWLRGRCTVRTFEGHTQGVSCVQFDDTRIVSGSSDKTIKVWNIRTNSPWSVQTLVGHSGTVRCLHLNGNRLVSGSTDCSIKVWDLSTEHTWSSIACKVTMTGHMDNVRCLQVDDEKVISGSYDQTLKIWDIKTGRCRKTLRGHEAAVLCVRFDERQIVSGSCDKTIKVWNHDGVCLRTLRGHQDAVTCLQFDTQRIVSGSLDCTLRFWQMQSGQCSNILDWKDNEGHTGVVRCLQADSWRVVSASDDRTLKVWSLETGKRLVTLRNHEDGVTCLQFNDRIIVSGSYDKTVKLWDFSSV